MPHITDQGGAPPSADPTDLLLTTITQLRRLVILGWATAILFCIIGTIGFFVGPHAGLLTPIPAAMSAVGILKTIRVNRIPTGRPNA